VAIRPAAPPQQQRVSTKTDTIKLPPRPARRGLRRVFALLLALIGLCGLAFAGYEARGQLTPRTFTATQQARIKAWEVAKRWRTMPKWRIFPAIINYQLVTDAPDKAGTLRLSAHRLAIAPQASCADGLGNGKLTSVLSGQGCEAVLRSTYTDATTSLVLTAGIAVLKDNDGAQAAAKYLASAGDPGTSFKSSQLVLRPFRVFGSSAASFGYAQRQLSWVATAGPYLVMTTVAYADGRPRVRVGGDHYAFQEMVSLARGVAEHIAAPLGQTPPTPRCPGVPSC